MGKRFLVLILLLGIAVIGAFAPTQASRTIKVCYAGCDYYTIQEAINAAAPGDTILLQGGTYQENLYITKDLILRGWGALLEGRGTLITIDQGPRYVVLEGISLSLENGGIGIDIHPAEESFIFLDKLRVINPIPHLWGIRSGTGIVIQTPGNISITNTEISGCFAAIAVTGPANVVILDSEISRSNIGISLTDRAQGLIKGNRFVEVGDSITLQHSSQARILFNFILHSTGISITDGSTASITGNILQDGARAIRIYQSSSAEISTNEIKNVYPYGIEVSSSRANIIRNNISDVRARGADFVAGIVLSSHGEVTTEVKISDNEISHIEGWGIALVQPPCSYSTTMGQPNVFTGKVDGERNKIWDAAQGNLCPEDYPWPAGFVKGSE